MLARAAFRALRLTGIKSGLPSRALYSCLPGAAVDRNKVHGLEGLSHDRPLEQRFFQKHGHAAWNRSHNCRRVRGAGDIRGKQDRKSTRLNSSHGYISYAVFCLKKKKRQQEQQDDNDKRASQPYRYQLIQQVKQCIIAAAPRARTSDKEFIVTVSTCRRQNSAEC